MQNRKKEFYARMLEEVRERNRVRDLAIETEKMAKIQEKLAQLNESLREKESAPPTELTFLERAEQLEKAAKPPNPLIKPRIPERKANRTIGPFQVDFDIWNEMLTCGNLKDQLNEIANQWYVKRVRERSEKHGESYFIENKQRILGLKLEQATQQDIEYVKERLAKAKSLGQWKKAAVLEYRLAALEESVASND